MAPGGLSNFCDDCGYQACLKANCCLQARADALGVDPQELVLEGIDLKPFRHVTIVLKARQCGVSALHERHQLVPADDIQSLRSEGVRRE